MLRKLLLTILFVATVSFQGYCENTFEFPDDMMDDLIACRECLLSTPDSCSEITKPLIIESGERQLLHIPAKLALMQGIGYAYKNDLENAIRLFKKAAEIASTLPPNDIHVNGLNNTANMYLSQGDSLMARKYFEQGLEAAKATGNFELILNSKIQLLSLLLSNPDASFHSLMDEVERGVDSLTPNSQAYFYLIKSDYELDQEDYASGLKYALKSYELYGNEDRIGMVSSSQNIGLGYIGLGFPRKALPYCHKGLEVALEDDMGLWKSSNCKCLWKAYKELGEHEKALLYLEQMNEFNDAVKNDDRIRELTALEIESEFEKARITDSLANVQSSIILEKENELKVDREKRKSQILILGLVALAIILFLLVRQMRNSKKVNQTISKQRDDIELRQTEIIDSINYAKRLQDAILPSPERFKNAQIDAFILYKPKDVVSGDFYWIHEKISVNGDELIYVAVGDCTGHGVPGAMVSVVCSSALEHAVKSLNDLNTGALLDQTNKLVQETFDTSSNTVSDGMDISLLGYNRTKNQFQFSGANNGLFILRDNKLIEVKGTRQPIGIIDDQKPFEVSDLEIQNGDKIYMTSDGFVDQFGNSEKDDGKSGKKFKKKSFKDIIINNNALSLDAQKNQFEEAHNSWKGDFEQTDDICLIGLQFKA